MPRGFLPGLRYALGPRRLVDLQILLGVAKQLLARRRWCKLLGDHRSLYPFTPEERHWLAHYWLGYPGHRRAAPYWAAAVLAAEFA